MSLNNKIECGTMIVVLIFAVFTILRLARVITWSWWFVTAPLWVPVLTLLLAAFIIVMTLAVDFIAYKLRKR